MADRKKRCTGSPRTDAVAEFLSAQEATAALQSEYLWLLLTYESIRLRDEGLQVDGTQPQAPDTLDDQGILTTTSSAADDEADSHTMHDDAAFISPPSAALAFKGASWGCLGDAMKSLSCGKAFYFDSRGDLVLKVGKAFHEGGRDFVVCSRTVARWSKVFNAMFFGGFAESISSARDGTWTIALPEDRAAPLFLILAIIHGTHQPIPMGLGRDELFDLLIVTEKYDMTHVLRPWASQWVQNLPLDNYENTTGQYRDVWIAWELGCEASFCKMLNDILWDCRVDDAGQLINVHGVPLSIIPCLEPSSILENISFKRAELIERLINCLRRAMKTSLTMSRCEEELAEIRHCNCSDVNFENRSALITKEDCDDLFLGRIMRRIREMGLEEFVLPRATFSSYLGSIHDLSDLILLEEVNGHVEGHDSCDLWIVVQIEVKEMVDNLSSPVTETHLEYLRNQAKKTGV
ncbi:hypothetical protein CGCF415_v004722 [Colletotrichum fructicola]|nr:hypothetical protein CGCF415_v004722 [Colletotrichum fructicola]KAF4936220.1 hypothetical protein CGCF245_v006729 [Colletotrichum fructicola]